MTDEELFQLTPDERARVDRARSLFRLTATSSGADAGRWPEWTATVHAGVLNGYAEGEIALPHALELARGCALPCELKDRVGLIAAFVERARLITPKTTGVRPVARDESPSVVRRCAIELIHILAAASGVSPSLHEGNGWRSPVLGKTIRFLVDVDLLTKPIKQRTLYGWYLEAAKDARPDVTAIATRVPRRTRTSRTVSTRKSRKRSPRRPAK